MLHCYLDTNLVLFDIIYCDLCGNYILYCCADTLEECAINIVILVTPHLPHSCYFKIYLASILFHNGFGISLSFRSIFQGFFHACYEQIEHIHVQIELN